MQQLHPENPPLTAHAQALREPDPDPEDAAAPAPELPQKIEEIEDIQHFLTRRLSPTKPKPPHQRENTRRSHQARDTAPSRQAWIIPAAAAAMLAMATFTLLRMTADKTPPADTNPPIPQVISPPRAPAATPPPPTPPPAPPPAPSAWFLPADAAPTTDLPITSAKANYAAISKSIREDRQLPPPQDVRFEEILNNFPLRLHGVTAIVRSEANHHSPSDGESASTQHLATLSTEIISCPWKPSASLLLISIRGNDQKDCDVKITFHPDLTNVFHHQLLGFHPIEGQKPGILPTLLPVNSVTTLALLIEPSTSANSLGSLEWSADDKSAPAIPLVRKNDAAPSDDARFAALVCTFAEWLTTRQEGGIDAETVAALARESASTTLPADRADFLTLIDRSLHL